MINIATMGQWAGEEIKKYSLTNSHGTCVELSNYGACILGIYTLDKYKKLDNIVLAYNTLDEYLKDDKYMGCVVGRYANRISGANIIVDDTSYSLSANEDRNTLHGGYCGFGKHVWTVEVIEDTGINGIKFHRISPHLEEGFPGNLNVTVTYILTEENTLVIKYLARCDRTTIVNLSSHSYYNLAGKNSNTISDHVLRVNASEYTASDNNLIPTGMIKSVTGTPYDFSVPRSINSNGEEYLYDLNYVLQDYNTGRLSLAASVLEPTSGRTMQVYTTQPGLQLYTIYDNIPRPAFCLETQHFPDSLRHKHFPEVRLKSGEVYNHVTEYRFGVV